jgi:hypothetical protein
LVPGDALEPRDRDGRLDAERRVAERDLHPVDEVAAAHRAGGRASEGRGEAEDAVEEIREVSERARVEAAEARSRAGHRRVAEPVVPCPLVGIAEDGIGLGRLLELLDGVRVVRIPVRVVHEGELAIGGLQRRVVRFAAHAQDFVVVAFLAHE